MQSDKLRHFTSDDPPPVRTRDAVRAEIEAQVQEYLARGGQIAQVAIAPAVYVKLSRVQQMRLAKSITYKRRLCRG